MALRYWSVYFDWRTKSEADLTPRVARGLRRVGGVVSGVFLHGGDDERKHRRGKSDAKDGNWPANMR